MIHRFYVLVISLLISCSIWQTATAQVVIFNSSPSVQPGQALSVQGNFSASAKVFLIRGTSGTPVQLPILTQGISQATAQIPTSVGMDLYQVWVEDQGQRSPNVYVNQARGIHFDSPEVAPSGSIRIFGRNLQLFGATARVRFVAPNGSSLDAGVNVSKSDAYVLTVDAPSGLQVGTVYSVWVSNGYGGSVGETKVDFPVTAIAPGGDYFQLGVGWAAKLNFTGNVYNVKTDGRLGRKAVGDGQANDQLAIQAAIDRASADGGGIVYLPAGTYKLDYSNFEGIHMRSRVVLQGAGKDQTIIKFGYNNNKTQIGIYWASDIFQSGAADLTLLNIDTNGESVGNMSSTGKEIFLQRIRFDINLGDWIWLAHSDKLVIANSDFSQSLGSQNNYHGPMLLNSSSNFVLRNNTFNFPADGIGLGDVHEAVLENNRFLRNGASSYPQSVITHVLALSFAQNLALLGNLFKVINGSALDHNDGETILAEGGGGDRIDQDGGTISAASANTIQDNAKNWGSFRLRPVVAIVSGPGRGQWRSISRGQGNTLTVDRPWGVVPTAGSRYAIFNWGARNWLVRDNTLEGNRRGIMFFFNATTEVAIVNNTLTNNGAIDFAPNQLMRNGRQEFCPVYNNQVVGNRVSNTDGSNGGTFIGVHAVQAGQTQTFGIMALGMDFRNNTVTARRPNSPILGNGVIREGYSNFLEYQNMSTYADEQVPAVLGSIFENNTAVNCDNALYLNTGSFNTVVCNMNLSNTGNTTLDSPIDKITRVSMGTGSCTPKTTATPPAPSTGSANGTGLRGDYFNNRNLSGTAGISRVDATVNFNWDGSPGTNIGSDNFSVRWNGQVEAPVTGDYIFSTTCDDGVRLWINGNQVISNWNDHGPTTDNSPSIALVAGQKYDIKIEYYESGGGASAKLQWSYPGQGQQVVPQNRLYPAPGATPATPATNPPPAPSTGSANGTGLRGDYFNNRNLSGTAGISRVDATVNFNWDGSPGTNIGSDNFSVRWSGQVEAPVTGDYIFSTTCDDGVRLWINGNQVISNWNDHGPTTDNSPSIALVAGQKYDIKIEYYESGGGASAKLQWSYPGQGQQVVPQNRLYPAPGATNAVPQTTAFLVTGGSANGTGLRGNYFNNRDLSGTAGISRVDATVNFNWDGSPGTNIGSDNFSVRWSGQVEAPVTGDYIFSTTCDDGVRLWINGNQVISNWNDHGPTTDNSPSIALVAGQKYDIKIEYYESGGGASAKLQWSYPGQGQQVVPQNRLYPAANGGRIAAEPGLEYDPAIRLQAYPIPAREEITLRYIADADGEAQVQLVSTGAQAVRELTHRVTAGENVIKLPVGDLSRGFYVLSLTQGHQRITRKVILAE